MKELNPQCCSPDYMHFKPLPQPSPPPLDAPRRAARPPHAPPTHPPTNPPTLLSKTAIPADSRRGAVAARVLADKAEFHKALEHPDEAFDAHVSALVAQAAALRRAGRRPPPHATVLENADAAGLEHYRETFKAALQEIAELNAASGSTVAYGVTPLTHLPREEFARLYLNGRKAQGEPACAGPLGGRGGLAHGELGVAPCTAHCMRLCRPAAGLHGAAMLGRLPSALIETLSANPVALPGPAADSNRTAEAARAETYNCQGPTAWRSSGLAAIIPPSVIDWRRSKPPVVTSVKFQGEVRCLSDRRQPRGTWGCLVWGIT
jgi:hypothetical protein